MSIMRWQPFSKLMSLRQVDITITGDTLTIKGETKAEEKVKPKQIKVKAKGVIEGKK